LTEHVQPGGMTRRPAQGAPGAWLRVLVGFLLLQLVGVQLWPALHNALFTHAVCAEHGELVHVAAHGDRADVPTRETTAISPLGAEDDAHDHCQLPQGTRELAAEPSEPASLVTSSGSSMASFVAVNVELPRSIPILTLAPKTSPPS
jgi:hypothetical protein